MRFIIPILLLIIQSGCAINHVVMVGDEKVIVQQTLGKGKTYVHVHQNEKTALKAARYAIRKQGGSLITLIHSGGRNIVFHLHHQRYEFDPNRIFTDKGIKNTLKTYSQYTPQAHREVKKLATKIKQLLPEGKVIAVHNNASYSLRDYLPGHKLAHDAKKIYVAPHGFYRNFYFVTQNHDYLRFKQAGSNSILQRPSAVDDGSLSVLLAKKAYTNVEAGYDQLTAQIKMLLQA